MIYIGLPNVQYSIERVAERVKAGGHNVPKRKIRERWSRSLDNFILFMNLADEVRLFSNAGTRPVLVGSRHAGGSFVLTEPEELPEITDRLLA